MAAERFGDRLYAAVCRPVTRDCAEEGEVGGVWRIANRLPETNGAVSRDRVIGFSSRAFWLAFVVVGAREAKANSADGGR
jgi:hypothetical protein